MARSLGSACEAASFNLTASTLPNLRSFPHPRLSLACIDHPRKVLSSSKLCLWFLITLLLRHSIAQADPCRDYAAIPTPRKPRSCTSCRFTGTPARVCPMFHLHASSYINWPIYPSCMCTTTLQSSCYTTKPLGCVVGDHATATW